MGWIAVKRLALPRAESAPTEVFVDDCVRDMGSDALLPVGSFCFDVEFSQAGATPARLVHFECLRDWPRRFTLYLNPDNSLSVECQQGTGRSYVAIDAPAKATVSSCRLTYSWDAPHRQGRFTIEDLDSGAIRQVTFDDPIPVPLADALAVIEASGSDKRLASASLANEVIPVGPAPTLAKGTLVETTRGHRPVEKLNPGDLVYTAKNELSPVRWIQHRQMPAVGSAQPVILRAPYLNLSKDIVVSGRQALMVTGADAEYLFGEEAVMVEARRLLGHPAATLDHSSSVIDYFQVLLDSCECICLAGAWAQSQYVGRLALAGPLLETTDFGAIPPEIMPVHSPADYRALLEFEATTLLDAMSA